MKTKVLFPLLMLACCCLLPGLSQAQGNRTSTMGRDFWVGFLPNYSGGSLSLLISGTNAT